MQIAKTTKMPFPSITILPIKPMQQLGDTPQNIVGKQTAHGENND
jgi:hypothetical protein